MASLDGSYTSRSPAAQNSGSAAGRLQTIPEPEAAVPAPQSSPIPALTSPAAPVQQTQLQVATQQQSQVATMPPQHITPSQNSTPVSLPLHQPFKVSLLYCYWCCWLRILMVIRQLNDRKYCLLTMWSQRSVEKLNTGCRALSNSVYDVLVVLTISCQLCTCCSAIHNSL